MKNPVTVTRTTTESKITVKIEKGEISADYRKVIQTPLPFLNHMIEHLVWRGGLNISVNLNLDEFYLTHVICEDVGMTLGKAVNAFVSENVPSGYGVGVGIIDESKAEAAISFEDRALLAYTSAVEIPAEVEGMPSEDLLTFLDGFAQGARCTLHLDIEKGVNGHHIWEAAFRAVGIALGQALTADENRKGKTSGVAGRVSYEVK